jgi:hypothetical protein
VWMAAEGAQTMVSVSRANHNARPSGNAVQNSVGEPPAGWLKQNLARISRSPTFLNAAAAFNPLNGMKGQGRESQGQSCIHSASQQTQPRFVSLHSHKNVTGAKNMDSTTARLNSTSCKK